jgi:hypothetical protein
LISDLTLAAFLHEPAQHDDPRKIGDGRHLRGGKRNRRSNDTDQPDTTLRNTCLSELSCWDEDGAAGKDATKEMMENEEAPSDHLKITGKVLGQVQDGTHPADNVNAGPGAEIIDVDTLISSGGHEIDDDEIVPGNTPKKFFSSFDVDLASPDNDEVREEDPQDPTDETNTAPSTLLNDDTKKKDNSTDNNHTEKKQ